MTDESPKMSEIENYLAHHGVKGMKWGVRRSSSTATSTRPRSSGQTHFPKPTPEQLAAFRQGSVKVGLATAKYGTTTIASVSGVAFPVALGLGVSVRILSDPAVQQGMKAAAEYLKNVANDTPLKDLVTTSNEKTSKIIQDKLKPYHPKTSPIDAGSRDGGMFNPKATIDRSQIDVRN